MDTTWSGNFEFCANEYVDGRVIVGIVILNAAFGFSQEFKAEREWKHYYHPLL